MLLNIKDHFFHGLILLKHTELTTHCFILNPTHKTYFPQKHRFEEEIWRVIIYLKSNYLNQHKNTKSER